MHEVLVNRLGGLSLPRKSVVRLTDRPDMTLDVYRGRKTTTQQIKQSASCNSQSFNTIVTQKLEQVSSSATSAAAKLRPDITHGPDRTA